jgi:hypothetical protein
MSPIYFHFSKAGHPELVEGPDAFCFASDTTVRQGVDRVQSAGLARCTRVWSFDKLRMTEGGK